MKISSVSCWVLALSGAVLGQDDSTEDQLQDCGDARYLASEYTCYDGTFLCPVIDGTPLVRCGNSCYLPSAYTCQDGQLRAPDSSSTASESVSASAGVPSSTISSTSSATSTSVPQGCDSEASVFQLSSPPYSNYFYSDCHSSSQVVVTSPIEDSNLTLIGPRFLVAWPAGNSGLVTFFAPQNGENGTLSIEVVNSTTGNPLAGIYEEVENGNATVGVTGQFEFNSTAVLSVAILGSIRTIRDFTEGPSLLYPEIQDAIINETGLDNGGASLSRLWLDNITTTVISWEPTNESQPITEENGQLVFPAGTYIFNASFNYPQLDQLAADEVLNDNSTQLITEEFDQTEALSFLSYTSKLTAGAWRFLTYFGRDSMITALLLQPVLSEGQGSAMEAVIAAVLERLNSTDGSVCHEETIGDYATWLNLQDNITSTEPSCTYPMIDTDYFLPVLLERYFVQTDTGASRRDDFLSTTATLFPWNANLTYYNLTYIAAQRVMDLTAAFYAEQTQNNLLQLKTNEIVGEWRDSTYGIGGGRIPYDVNTALAPAALRAIAALSRSGFFPSNDSIIQSWGTLADEYAQVWEDNTLQFFEISLSQSEADELLDSYTSTSSFNGSSQTDAIDASGVTFHALALDGNNNLSQVAVMNSDDCFRLFLLTNNTSNQTQLTNFINSTANNVRRRFPAGLMTDVSMLVANPAYGNDSVYAANWTTSAYHGTVVWSWPLAMMAKGFELQLDRCEDASNSTTSTNSTRPEFCDDQAVYDNVRNAYNVLWDSIEANQDRLTNEVWSFIYEDGNFTYVDLGELPPPPGVNPTESNIVQLWSLTFLAVTRNEDYN